MRLLHVISSVNPKGGGPIEGVRQLQGLLAAINVKMEIACCDAPDDSWVETTTLDNVHALGPSTKKYAYNPRLLPWLRQNASRFDAIVVEGIWQYHSFATWIALKGTTVPYFVFTHGMLGPWFKHTYPIKHFKKWLYWPWAEYRVLRDARAVLFTCEEERRLARESFWLYRAHEEVTGYGTSIHPYQTDDLSNKFSAKYPNLKNKRLILFLGRIHEVKGCDLLLKSFADVAALDDRLHLLIVGPDEGALATALKAEAKELHINDRITWTGALYGEEKWAVLHASEVFCLPSHHENFGVVVAEALACGKPVLISNKVHIWREIAVDRACFVDDDTVAGTVRNLKRWLALSSAEYLQMSSQARQCFLKNFDISYFAKNLVSIIGKCRK